MTVFDLMVVMITRVNHRHSVLGPRVLCPFEAREAPSERGTSLVLIPVSRPLSGAQLHLPPLPKAAALLSIALAGSGTPCLTVYLCSLCQREGKSKMPPDFWLGQWGDDSATFETGDARQGTGQGGSIGHWDLLGKEL